MLGIKDEEFIRLKNYIHENYGINLEHKKTLVEGRLGYLLSEKGYESFQDYLNFLFTDKSGQEMTTLLNRLTTNHTFFMREEEHFRFLKERILPDVTRNCRSKDLRIWSAGCSTGEEPYTLAMILKDYFGLQKHEWDSKILATDISARALDAAEKAVYNADELEKVPDSWKKNYFKKLEDDNYIVREEMRSEVIFRVFNLMNDFPFRKKFHVIFCRNVMIYFDNETKSQLVNKFHEWLESGGYLIIGHSESLARNDHGFRYIIPAVYRKE
ncbi:MAG: protein-glutamate O-methyltransferase CheR [Clostridiales bacterium]|nr:protein-glutamate O-methyltransferase CheR [Clostridiales bacterium]